MTNLVRIIYVSRSTFVSASSARGIDPSVARILAKSRANNRNNGLVGVLYFGDGCFFQCLEGEESAVDALYQKLLADKRHTDLKLISRETIKQSSFDAWSMKYVPSEKNVWNVLREEGLNTFDPYRLSSAGIKKLLGVLLETSQAEEDTDVSETTRQDGVKSVAPFKPKQSTGGHGRRLFGTVVLVAVVLTLILWAARDAISQH